MDSSQVKYLRKMEGPLTPTLRTILHERFADFTEESGQFLRALLQQSDVSCVYRPVYGFEPTLFSQNRIALIGNAAKLHYPVLSNYEATDIDDAWCLIKHVAPATSLEKLRYMQPSWKRPDARIRLPWTSETRRVERLAGRFILAEILQQYSKERTPHRRLHVDPKGLRVAGIATKYARDSVGLGDHPYAFTPYVFKYLVYRRLFDPGMIARIKLPSNIAATPFIKEIAKINEPVLAYRTTFRGRSAERVKCWFLCLFDVIRGVRPKMRFVLPTELPRRESDAMKYVLWDITRKLAQSMKELFYKPKPEL